MAGQRQEPEQVAQQIYQGLNGNWEAALTALANHFDANTANITLLYPHHVRGSFTYSYGWDPDLVELAAELHASDPRNDPRLHRVDALDRPHSCRSVVDTETLHTSAMYRHVLAPAGIEYALRVFLRHHDKPFALAAVTRAPDACPFDNSDLLRLQALVPVLKDVTLAERWRVNALITQQIINDDLLGSRSALVIVDQQCRLVDANDAGRRLWSKDGPLILVSSQVLGRKEALEKQIARIFRDVRAMTNSNGGKAAENNLAQAFGRGKAGFWTLTVTPIEMNNAIAEGGGSALTRLFALTVRYQADRSAAAPDIRAYARRYSLTRRETDVLKALVRGARIRTISRQLQISENTARSYLKSLLKKTGARRQTDLVRLVLTGDWNAAYRNSG